MSIARHHAEWLSLVEVSGPFLSVPVLMEVFPQGLDAHVPDSYKELHSAFEEWQDNQLGLKPDPAIHNAWIRYVLNEALELNDDVIKEGQTLPLGLEAHIAEHGITLRPDLAVVNPSGRSDAGKARMLIKVYDQSQGLEKPVSGIHWKASPATSMMELLHSSDIKLGLVTNGEHWMLVHAPRGETTTFASWYSTIWLEEKITLQAFRSLLSAHRFFGVADDNTPEGLFARSADNQQEVTDQLGYQVRKAVEVLVQAIDRIDKDRGRMLLSGANEDKLYESALTVMMRLVFLFSAEERGLLLLGDPLYDDNYAVSTLREILRETADQLGEEILERRYDAWPRLLATFRGVYGGIRHDRLQSPPYGGSLFNPDRFPFLEGRLQGTSWIDTPAEPLRINNRTVLHLLEALQILQVKVPGGGPAEARRLSFRALDIEQIGHVYEGMLDHKAERATEPMLGLIGSKNSEPEVALSVLENMLAKGMDEAAKYLKEQTGRSEAALKKALENPGLIDEQRLRIACDNSDTLYKRVRPFAPLLRDDTLGYPTVINADSVFVTSGETRRATGTHYTPRSLTEPIVQYTLEPLVYIGPADGKPKEEWRLRSPKELLALKICDMAVGSGAFLVQTCRYMSERLVEAWEEAEAQGGIRITPECELAHGLLEERILSADPDERLAIARRIIADRCLYGVDKNPMAVEMAKLSLWLITLSKNKPFTFLDHALKSGDSLLGLSDIEQITRWSLDKSGSTLLKPYIERHVSDAVETRRRLEYMPDNDIREVQEKEQLHAQAEAQIARLKLAGDLIIGAALAYKNPKNELLRSQMIFSSAVKFDEHITEADDKLRDEAEVMLHGNRPFHWALEFPEVFLNGKRGGFDVIISNPPFRGGLMITRDFSLPYTRLLKSTVAEAGTTTDLCAYFIRRAYVLIGPVGAIGFLASNSISEGDTREASLDAILQSGGSIFRAISSTPWPGSAALHISVMHVYKQPWLGPCVLDGKVVCEISSSLRSGTTLASPKGLAGTTVPGFLGTTVYGKGFFLDTHEAKALIAADSRNATVIRPFLNGDDVLSNPKPGPSRWVLCFQGLSEKEASCFVAPFQLAKDRVYPERQGSSSKRRREKWWLYTSPATELYEAVSDFKRVLVTCFTSKYVVFTFVAPDIVFSNAVIVIATEDYSGFASLQSSFHPTWVAEYSSTLETRQRYALSDCLETFPFPRDLSSLKLVGERYYGHRQWVMLSRQEGLTNIYNRFHNLDDNSEDIAELRRLHVEMDNAVAAAYGWTDLDLDHGFHETKQGIRFTISEPARQEVLDRLLLLNHERYAEEMREQELKENSKSGKKKSPKKATLPGMDT
ncbi:MAG: restriction endonuclease [Armatimonadetes bacterium]|nr:restriction endonuclease [Armatimonadota bacterium]